MESKDFLGLNKKAAQDKAEANNLIFRLIRIDDKPYFDMPSEFLKDRICVEIENGRVVTASLF